MGMTSPTMSDSPEFAEGMTAAVIDNILPILPEKSRDTYEHHYQQFMEWKKKNDISSFSQNVIVAYFGELSSDKKSSTLWKIYSILRCTLNVKHNIDIGNYAKLRDFLRRQSKGFQPKKSKIFTAEEIKKFINEAPDETYLATKVVLIVAIMGGCRKNELRQMKVDHIQDLGTAVLINVPDATKIKKLFTRKFTITGDFYTIFKKYWDARPADVGSDSFFVNYQKGCCTKQIMGIQKLGSVPRQVATFLRLKNPEQYTGHCFKRTSASTLIDADGNITTLRKKSGTGKSTEAADGDTTDGSKSTEIADGDTTDGENSIEDAEGDITGGSKSTEDSAITTITTTLKRPMDGKSTEVTKDCESMTEVNSKRRKINEGSLTGFSSANNFYESEHPLCELSSHDFATIKKTITFVDKTLFIKSVLTDVDKIVFLTGPRAFGKSTLMDMLKQFLLGKSGLFRNLKLYTEEESFFWEHCLPHPVIHIELGSVGGSTFAEVKKNLALVVNETFRRHAYLVKKTCDGALVWASDKLRSDVRRNLIRFERYFDYSKCIELDEGDLGTSLRFLSEVLHTHYRERVYILIDDYDASAMSMAFTNFVNKDEIDLIDNLLRRFIANTLTFNNFIQRALIFACVRLAGIFSLDAIRVIKHYPFLSELRYAPYLGFTAGEVEQLLEKPQVKNICGDLKTVHLWYDGYIVSGDNTLKIYSTWSILNHLKDSVKCKKAQFSSFWIETGHVKNMKSLFAEPSIREKIEQVITPGGEIKLDRVKSVTLENIKGLNKLINLDFDELSEDTVDLFLQFLADSGYFNILRVEKQEQVDEKNDAIKQEIEDEPSGELEDQIEQIEEHIKDEELTEALEEHIEEIVDEDMEESRTHCILRVPNFEIMKHLREVCYDEAFSIKNKYNISSKDIKSYINTLGSVLEDPSERTFSNLAKAVLGLFSASGRSIIHENEFHNVLYTLAYNSRCFVTHSEVQIKTQKKEPGITSILDVVITMNANGIIFEPKVNSKPPTEALKEIFIKRYHTKFENPGYEHISKKIYAGLSFNVQKKVIFISYLIGSQGRSKSVSSNM